jgi:hypothetical protein
MRIICITFVCRDEDVQDVGCVRFRFDLTDIVCMVRRDNRIQLVSYLDVWRDGRLCESETISSTLYRCDAERAMPIEFVT